MGLQQSKEELLYQQVNYGNVDGIRTLRAQGAGLEWIDKEGKTPLMVACMRPNLLNVAKVLIELGANVNAYRPGSHCGTALHHAAKKGLEKTVHLLISHGANPFITNDNCNTALELAREKGHVNVVRAIEGRISLFCGWMRENYAPGFLEAFASHFMTRKIWAVVLPLEVRSPTRPLKLELAIYPELQKSQIEEPKLNQADPSITIFDKGTKSRYKLLSTHEGNKQQLQWFYSACCGIPQVVNMVAVPPANPPVSNPLPVSSSLAPSELSTPSKEDDELAMAINASIQSAIAEGAPNVQPTASTTNTSGWGSTPSNSLNGWDPTDAPAPPKISGQARVDAPSSSTYNGWDVPGTSSNLSSLESNKSQNNHPTVIPQEALPAFPVPSAPPFAEETFFNGLVQYPSVDSTPVDVTMLATSEGGTAATSVKAGENEAGASGSGNTPSGTCVICLDAPVEGACIPCGHMAGCMSCLNDIESKKWGCPICRATINQVVRLYAV
ncbi:probable E3 ubiquitin-protein ligase XBOS34 isoform X2 [Phragmites australis]|uniref:probable E3 ubiquitin-protein ligase XBOS34 isoform X2 n=1 Tax=Phragmites australis TaxID=29695 RepID=UPI002D794DFD|nr:probable E3 ubiquitin-protein ligase XBOS34 isoform X2 [Phragmites australis]